MRQCNPDISPEHANALWHASQPTGGTTITAKCTLITPMYGGGVQAGVVDRAMPIRASALRGQLRFWWRLLYGGGRPPTEVFKDECALWGGISTDGPQASQVAVRVACSAVEGSPWIDGEPSDVPDYVLILDQHEDAPELLKQGYSFNMTLEFHSDEKKEQVVEALRWWASFSGVGARTRRGFGAVKVDAEGADLSPVRPEEVQQKQGWMLTGKKASAIDAWQCAIGALKSFRQHRGGGQKTPGRSNWPESDAIRRVTRTHARPPQHLIADDEVYPRAAFGLPIVFHFKDRGDPDDVVVTHEDSDRMASPLILRPYFDGQGYRPLALLLPDWEHCVGVRVSLGQKSSKPVKAWPDDMNERKHLAAQIEPMKKRGEDALSAFMRYFEERQR